MMNKKHITIILAVSIILQFFWISAIFMNNKAYLFDYSLQPSPDAFGYYRSGYNILNYRVFSCSSSFPLLLGPLRTPGYPFLIALAIFICPKYSVLLIILLQVALYILGILLLYSITKMILNEKIAFLASILMSLDLTSQSMIYEILSETFYTTALLLAAWLALRYLKSNATWKAILLGVSLALVLYIRPAGISIVLFTPLYLLLSNIKNKRNVLSSFFCFAILIIAVAPWIYRNYTVFKMKKMDISGSLNIVFITGAHLYEKIYGIPKDEARYKISKDFNLPEYERFVNYGIDYADYNKYDKKLMVVGKEIILNHPKEFIIRSMLSPIEAMLSPATNNQALMLKKTYVHIGLSNIIKFNLKNLFKNFKENSVLVNVLFAYEVIFNLLNLILFICGILFMIYFLIFRRLKIIKWDNFFLILIFIGCLFLVTASVGTTTYFRYRVPNMPFVFIFVAFVLFQISGFYKKEPKH